MMECINRSAVGSFRSRRRFKFNYVFVLCRRRRRFVSSLQVAIEVREILPPAQPPIPLRTNEDEEKPSLISADRPLALRGLQTGGFWSATWRPAHRNHCAVRGTGRAGWLCRIGREEG